MLVCTKQHVTKHKLSKEMNVYTYSSCASALHSPSMNKGNCSCLTNTNNFLQAHMA